MGMKVNHLSCKLKEHDERRSLPNAYLVSRLPSGKQTTSPPWTPRVLSRSCIGDDGVYHLQEVSAKSGWKDNGTRLFGSFRRTMLIGATENLKRYMILFFEFHFFKAVFDTSFSCSQPFFSRWSWFVHWYGKRHFAISEFCLPFTQTVNRPVCPCIGKQPILTMVP